MGAPLVPVGPDVPALLASILRSHEAAISALQQPDGPVALPKIDTAANLMTRAPAARFPDCAIQVVEKACIAISINVAGTWTWLRADGSAL